jgi:hypothetical protein
LSINTAHYRGPQLSAFIAKTASLSDFDGIEKAAHIVFVINAEGGVLHYIPSLFDGLFLGIDRKVELDYLIVRKELQQGHARGTPGIPVQ